LARTREEMSATSGPLYSVFIFSKSGACIYYQDFTGRKPQGDLDEQKLVFGMLFSLKRFIERTSPLADDDGSFKHFTTSAYRLHFFQAPTGLRFVCLSDPKGKDAVLLCGLFSFSRRHQWMRCRTSWAKCMPSTWTRACAIRCTRWALRLRARSLWTNSMTFSASRSCSLFEQQNMFLSVFKPCRAWSPLRCRDSWAPLAAGPQIDR
jgi:hypothetical protein